MACGTPIVSVDVGDVVETISDTPGCFIAERDANDVAQKIRMAMYFKGKTPGRQRIIELGDKKELVTQEDLPYIVSDVLKHTTIEERVKLVSYMVSTAYGLKPVASVRLEVNGTIYEETATGDGQYDAFVRCVRHIYKNKLKRDFPWLSNYMVSIPPGGRTDALVQTTIEWQYHDKTYRTHALDADQTEAAIKATIKLLNMINN
jgi:D-citramalate synthase